MGAETPDVGAVGPIVAGVLPNQPRRVVLEARALAEALGTPLVFAYVEINEDMTQDVRDILRVLESSMAGTRIPWSLRVLAGDPGRALARLGSELHARMIVVGTRHQGLGAKESELLNGFTAHHVTAHQELPVLVVPVHHELT